jgi:hypothetical protein
VLDAAGSTGLCNLIVNTTVTVILEIGSFIASTLLQVKQDEMGRAWSTKGAKRNAYI